MKRNFIKLIFFTFLVIGVYSCENSALVEPPAFVKKPVIVSFISPQSAKILAQLSYSKPYWGNTSNDTDMFILDAKVYIYDINSNKKAEMVINSSNGVYEADSSLLPIVNLHMYKLEVILSNGKTYFANCTVPPKPVLKELKLIDHTFGISNFISKDISTGFEYYSSSILMYLQYTGQLGHDFYTALELRDSIENSLGIFNDIDLTKNVQNEIIRGNNNNKLDIYFNQDFNFFNPEFSLKSIFGTIYTMDKAYSEFYKTQDFFNTSNDNPFTEPMILATNFSDGAVGIFGSYDFVQGVVFRK